MSGKTAEQIIIENQEKILANQEQVLANQRKLEDIKMLLEGAINALGKVGLMLNVHKNDLKAVIGVLPALKRPTISHLSDDDWLAVNTILLGIVADQFFRWCERRAWRLGKFDETSGW